MPASRRTRRTVVLVLGYLMIAHFLLGILFTVWLMIGMGAYAECLWFLLPYVGILTVFVLSVLLAHVRRLAGAAVALVLGLALSVGACVYDFTNARWQLNGGGIGAGYTIWWWYYEPFWHGYRPGNI